MLKRLERIAYKLEDRHKDYALRKKYEYLKSINAGIEIIEETINEGAQRLEVHKKWGFYENLIKHSYIKPETESDLKDIIYDAKRRRIVFEIYQDKCERGIIKDEPKEELQENVIQTKQNLTKLNIDSHIEQSGRGFHLWIFFEKPIWNA